MPHLDPDRLVEIALTDSLPVPEEAAHLDRCADCRADLAATRTVAELSRGTDELHDLPAPAHSVWDRIAAATFATPPGEQTGISTAGQEETTAAGPPDPSVSTARSPRALDAAPHHRPGDAASHGRLGGTAPPGRAGAGAAPTGRADGTAPSGGGWVRRRGRVRLALVALVALVVGAAGTAGVQWLSGRPGDRVVAHADLVAQPAAPHDARGSVDVVDTGHGLQLRISISGMPAPAGYYTVWLFDGHTVMIPVGSPGRAPLNVPAAADDLNVFRIVDVSAQDLGQHEHGTSMLQGTLHR